MFHSAEKTQRRGASRKQERSRFRLPVKFLRYSVVGLMLTMSIGLCWVYGTDVVARVMNRPIAKVGIEGDFKFVNKSEIAEIIAVHINKKFVQLDLHEIKSRLEEEPWISQVFLTRRWPDQLYVRVEEQQPIARWADRGFINQRGEIIHVPMNEYLLDLPQLAGEEAMATRMMQNYLAFNKLLRPKALEVLSLTCDGKQSWDVHWSNGVVVRLGRDDLSAKIQRAILVYEKLLKQSDRNVDVIDARYNQGVAVSWIPDVTSVDLSSKKRT